MEQCSCVVIHIALLAVFYCTPLWDIKYITLNTMGMSGREALVTVVEVK